MSSEWNFILVPKNTNARSLYFCDVTLIQIRLSIEFINMTSHRKQFYQQFEDMHIIVKLQLSVMLNIEQYTLQG